jgi:hypothetical protein
MYPIVPSTLKWSHHSCSHSLPPPPPPQAEGDAPWEDGVLQVQIFAPAVPQRPQDATVGETRTYVLVCTRYSQTVQSDCSIYMCSCVYINPRIKSRNLRERVQLRVPYYKYEASVVTRNSPSQFTCKHSRSVTAPSHEKSMCALMAATELQVQTIL